MRARKLGKPVRIIPVTRDQLQNFLDRGEVHRRTFAAHVARTMLKSGKSHLAYWPEGRLTEWRFE